MTAAQALQRALLWHGGSAILGGAGAVAAFFGQTSMAFGLLGGAFFAVSEANLILWRRVRAELEG